MTYAGTLSQLDILNIYIIYYIHIYVQDLHVRIYNYIHISLILLTGFLNYYINNIKAKNNCFNEIDFQQYF